MLDEVFQHCPLCYMYSICSTPVNKCNQVSRVSSVDNGTKSPRNSTCQRHLLNFRLIYTFADFFFGFNFKPSSISQHAEIHTVSLINSNRLESSAVILLGNKNYKRYRLFNFNALSAWFKNKAVVSIFFIQDDEENSVRSW